MFPKPSIYPILVASVQTMLLKDLVLERLLEYNPTIARATKDCRSVCAPVTRARVVPEHIPRGAEVSEALLVTRARRLGSELFAPRLHGHLLVIDSVFRKLPSLLLGRP